MNGWRCSGWKAIEINSISPNGIRPMRQELKGIFVVEEPSITLERENGEGGTLITGQRQHSCEHARNGGGGLVQSLTASKWLHRAGAGVEKQRSNGACPECVIRSVWSLRKTVRERLLTNLSGAD